MTFVELQNQTLRACGHTTATSSEPRTRVKAEINAWHRRLLTRPGFARLLRDSENAFFTVAGQRVYGLAVGRILGIQAVEDRTVLALRDLAWLRRSGTLSSLGTPEAYVPRGAFPVLQHPHTPNPIQVASSSLLDVTQIIDWTVITSDLQRISGTSTLTGTTQVPISLQVAEIIKWTMRTAAVGTVTLTSQVGHVLARLIPGQLTGRFLHVELFPTPSSALQYRIDYTREIVDLVDDTDVPLLPPDYHHILAIGAEYDEWRKLSDDRMGVAKQDLEQEIKSLNAWLWDLPDDSQLSRIPMSRLGGMFPADTWR